MPIDEVIRHFVFPNLEQLRFLGTTNWSSETYETIKRKYNLRFIQDLHLPEPFYAGYTITSSAILRSASNLRYLDAASIATTDEDTFKDIASGKPGYFLKVLTISCFEPDIEKVLDMVEGRQKTVARKVERGYIWREDEMAGLKEVIIMVLWDGMFTRRRNARRGGYDERLVELKRLGVRVEILASQRGLLQDHY